MSALCLDRGSVYRGDLILVNREHGYREEPAPQLVPVTGEPDSPFLCRKAAALLDRLMAEIQGWSRIVPVSGWRSLGEQQDIWDSTLAESGLDFTRTYVALPGHSEHQTGLAIDLGLKQDEIDFIRPDFPYTGICGTFRDKAADYGFVERYPKAKEAVTGIGHEPWHFRYVGAPHAGIMVKEGLVLEEYVEFIRQFRYGRTPYLVRHGNQEIAVSFVEAEGARTTLALDGSAYTISGNNVDGWILTQWRTTA